MCHLSFLSKHKVSHILQLPVLRILPYDYFLPPSLKLPMFMISFPRHNIHPFQTVMPSECKGPLIVLPCCELQSQNQRPQRVADKAVFLKIGL